MHWPSNVLELLFTYVLERDVELVAHLVVHDSADTDPARLGERFEAGRDVDPVAEDVASVADDVSEVDADAELDQPPVAGGFDNSTAMLLDLWVAELAAHRLQRGERPLLVLPHQPRIARDIGGQDRGKTAGLAHIGGSQQRLSLELAKWPHETTIFGLGVGMH